MFILCGYFNHTFTVCRERIREEAEKSYEGSTASILAFSSEQSDPKSPNTFASPASTDAFLLSLSATSTWCADSGATNHMTDTRDYLKKFESRKSGP